MNIEVLFFAQVREALGANRASLQVDAGVTVAGVVDLLAQRAEWCTVSALPMTFAVNEHVVDDSHTLHDGDRLALLTPVSGG